MSGSVAAFALAALALALSAVALAAPWAVGDGAVWHVWDVNTGAASTTAKVATCVASAMALVASGASYVGIKTMSTKDVPGRTWMWAIAANGLVVVAGVTAVATFVAASDSSAASPELRQASLTGGFLCMAVAAAAALISAVLGRYAHDEVVEAENDRGDFGSGILAGEKYEAL